MLQQLDSNRTCTSTDLWLNSQLTVVNEIKGCNYSRIEIRLDTLHSTPWIPDSDQSQNATEFLVPRPTVPKISWTLNLSTTFWVILISKTSYFSMLSMEMDPLSRSGSVPIPKSNQFISGSMSNLPTKFHENRSNTFSDVVNRQTNQQSKWVHYVAIQYLPFRLSWYHVASTTIFLLITVILSFFVPQFPAAVQHVSKYLCVYFAFSLVTKYLPLCTFLNTSSLVISLPSIPTLEVRFSWRGAIQFYVYLYLSVLLQILISAASNLRLYACVNVQVYTP